MNNVSSRFYDVTIFSYIVPPTSSPPSGVGWSVKKVQNLHSQPPPALRIDNQDAKDSKESRFASDSLWPIFLPNLHIISRTTWQITLVGGLRGSHLWPPQGLCASLEASSFLANFTGLEQVPEAAVWPRHEMTESGEVIIGFTELLIASPLFF